MAKASAIVFARRARFGLADIGLAVLVVSVVAMMIVPLPTWLLDILIATNLSMSVAILLVVLYVPDALAIATFPTILLLTTLFRLALNVSSARLILLQANAGEVIRAFGNFVVRGNYIVGGIVFLILTIIQFVVIAKGGERVAEVTARFTAAVVVAPTGTGELSGIVDIHAGYDYSCALLGSDEVYCWGWNAQGQLGNGDTTDHTVPTKVTYLQ